MIDARFAKPLDGEALHDAARHCRRVVTVEDHVALGGFGSAVLELLAPEVPRVPVRVLGLGDRFVEHGDVRDQWRSGGIDAESVAERTARWLERRR